MDLKHLGVIAVTQHGLVTRSQVIDWGSRSRLRTLLRTQVLIEMLPGVYRMCGSPVTWEQRLCAATLSTPGAVASHRSAARLWGMNYLTNQIEITVPRGRSMRKGPSITVHESEQLTGHTDTCNGISVTTPARTFVDLSAVTSSDRLQKCLERSLLDNIFTRAEVEMCLDKMTTKGRPRITLPREMVSIVNDVDESTTTDFELEVLRWLRAAGLPDPIPQFRCVTRSSTYHFDFAYPEHRIAIEADGRFHLTESQVAKDKERDADVGGLGWMTFRATRQSDRRRYVESVLRAYKQRCSIVRPA